MAYQLNFSLTPAEAIPLVVQDQLQKAVEQLNKQPDGLHEAVHDARKRLKKVRAVVRLLRPGLGEKQYKQLNKFYRDAGRKMAPLRDAFVRKQTLAQLQEDYKDKFKVSVFQTMQEQLNEDLQLLEGVAKEEDLLTQLAAQLEENMLQVAQWPLQKISWKSILKGHGRTYKRAYTARPLAYKQETAAAFHEWRKRIKYSWYHYRLVKDLWQPVIKVQAKETHKLASLLGDAHDMSEFLAYQVPEVPNELLQWSAKQEQEKLRSEARPLGKKLLSLPPKQHQEQLEIFLKLKLQRKENEH